MCNQTGNSAYNGYGVINLALWGHAGFNKLSFDSRLLFLYLIAGPETMPSGLFQIDTDSMTHAAGHANLSNLGSLITYEAHPPVATVWIHGMFEAIKGPQVLQEAVEQVLLMPASPLVTKFLARHNLSVSTPSAASDGILAAVSKVILVDLLQMDVQDMHRVWKLERAGYTAEQVLECFQYPDGFWYKNDWRGQKGQKPNMTNVEKEIKGLLHCSTSPQKPIDKRLLVRDVTGVLGHRNGRKTSWAHAQIAEKYGEIVWEKMISVLPWRDWHNVSTSNLKFRVYEALNAS